MYEKIKATVGFIISICALVYLFKIRMDTKVDTFKQPLETGKKEQLFYSSNTTSSQDYGIKCELYQNAIMYSKVTKLEDVFNLNIESIHTKSTWLLLIFLFSISFLLLTLISILFLDKSNSLCALCLTCLTILVNVGLYIANIVIFIFLLLAFYNGDTHRFNEFLSCRNVNKNEFNDYLYAEKLNKDFNIFVILNIISLFINYQKAKSTQSNNENQQGEQKKVEIVESKYL